MVAPALRPLGYRPRNPLGHRHGYLLFPCGHRPRRSPIRRQRPGSAQARRASVRLRVPAERPFLLVKVFSAVMAGALVRSRAAAIGASSGSGAAHALGSGSPRGGRASALSGVTAGPVIGRLS